MLTAFDPLNKGVAAPITPFPAHQYDAPNRITAAGGFMETSGLNENVGDGVLEILLDSLGLNLQMLGAMQPINSGGSSQRAASSAGMGRPSKYPWVRSQPRAFRT